MKKFSVCLLCCVFMLGSVLIPTKAQGTEENLPEVTMSEFLDGNKKEALPDKFILTDDKQTRDNEYTISTKVGSPFEVKEYYVGYHPQLTTKKKASFYYFSNSKTVSVSASIGYGAFSFGASATADTTAGWGITCDGSRYSKVAMKPSFQVQKYKIQRINSATGNVVSTSYSYSHVLIAEYNYCEYVD